MFSHQKLYVMKIDKNKKKSIFWTKNTKRPADRYFQSFN